MVKVRTPAKVLQRKASKAKFKPEAVHAYNKEDIQQHMVVAPETLNGWKIKTPNHGEGVVIRTCFNNGKSTQHRILFASGEEETLTLVSEPPECHKLPRIDGPYALPPPHPPPPHPPKPPPRAQTPPTPADPDQ
jgi:hypothetical protein